MITADSELAKKFIRENSSALAIACIMARSDKRVDALDSRQVDILASIYMHIGLVELAQKLNKFDFDDDAQFYCNCI